MTIVNRLDFHGSCEAVGLTAGASKTRHTQQQSDTPSTSWRTASQTP
jgi:hypothetical protein